MKNIYLICTMLLFVVSAYAAKEKVVERSTKVSPSWVGISKTDYVIVSSEGETLDGVKQSCLSDIKQSIVNAVAVNITSEENSSQIQQDNNGSISISQSYESDLKTIAARLPFITGISLSKGEIYWEKRYVKSQKRHYYICHIKYPFSEDEQNSLISEFMAQDRAQYDKYLKIKANLDTFTEVEYIERAITDLSQLSNYFIDNLRRNEVLALQRNYRSLYTSISLVSCGNYLGRHTFSLLINGRKVTTSRTPILKSEYATNLTIKSLEEGLYELTYNHENSLDDSENKIDLIYLFPNKALKHTFYFDVRTDKMAVIPFGVIELDLRKDPESDNIGIRIDGKLNLRSKYDNKFKVVAINLTVNGISRRIECKLDQQFDGKTNHRLSFTIDESFSISDSRDVLAQGFIKLLNITTNEVEQISFALPYTITIN